MLSALRFLPAILPRAYGFAARLCKAAVVAAALATPAAAAEEIRLMAFGDSLVHGYGLPPAEGFVPQLEAWLEGQGHGPVAVQNMGVSGDTTAGGRARLEWALGDGADAAIIVLGGNDLLRGLEPSDTRANLDAMLESLEARGIPVLLAGMRAPLNYGADWKAEFDAIYPDLAEAHGAVLVESFLAPVIERPDLVQDDGIHPNAEGVAAIVAALGPQVAELLQRVSGR